MNDGVIKEVGESDELGRYIRLQDVYGNRFTYAHLGSVASFYPVPKSDPDPRDAHATAGSRRRRAIRKPTAPASAGSQPEPTIAQRPRTRWASSGPPRSLPVKERLFAHPAIRERASRAVSSR